MPKFTFPLGDMAQKILTSNNVTISQSRVFDGPSLNLNTVSLRYTLLGIYYDKLVEDND